jgi:hypothetical protein
LYGASQDILQFGAGIAPSDISLERHGDDLVVKISGASDQITIHNWYYSGSVFQIESFSFADGTVWDLQQIQQIPLALLGTVGDDVLYGWQQQANTITGLDGNDLLVGGTLDDLLRGGLGNDTLYGNEGNNSLQGDEGNDTIFGGNGSNLIEGGAGDDTLYAVNSIYDYYYYYWYGTVIESGNNIVLGGDGNDYLLGGTKDDILSGDDGNDYVQGWLGDDVLDGGAGDDKLFDSQGSNTFIGGAGNDQLYGGTGDDLLDGGAGDDALFSGSGNDTIRFGLGDGADVMVSWSGDGAPDMDTYASTRLTCWPNATPWASTWCCILPAPTIALPSRTTSLTPKQPLTARSALPMARSGMQLPLRPSWC